MAYFYIKQDFKEAALLYLLREVIKFPTKNITDCQKTPLQMLLFVSTKHHAEYICQLLKSSFYSVAMLYGSMEATNRQNQLNMFKKGLKSILVVTDVAARGIDLPLLDWVVNYDCCTQEVDTSCATCS